MLDTKITFNTGYTLEFRPISRSKLAKARLTVKRKFEAEGEPLDPPRYVTMEATSTVEAQTKPHNKTTLFVDGDREQTKENAKAWGKHKLALHRLQQEQQIEEYKYILLNGIVTDTTPTEEWLSLQKELGETLSDNKEELEILYIYDEILISPYNAGLVYGKVLSLIQEGGISRLEVEATKNSF